MSMFKCVLINIMRKPTKNIILCMILIIIFLGELIGICVYSIAKNGEEDAFIYHGSDFIIEGENLNLTPDIYKQITSIEHVVGVNNWKEILAEPVGMDNVKEYTGINPGVETEKVDWSKNSVILVALMDTKLYSWFRWEKSVSLIAGTYPDSKNKGVIIESRFAEQNNLSLGDEITYALQGSDKECTYNVCGIFKVDSEFEITEYNPYGEGVFKYSPYNVAYIDYEYASETIGFESYAPKGCEVYVDKYESIEKVGVDLRNLLGKDAEIYNTANGYLNNERGVVVLMKNYSLTILGYVTIIGGIIMLLLLTFYASQYQQECGIFLALGGKKARVILQYFLSMLVIIVIAFFISGIIFHFTAEQVVYSLDDSAKLVISKNYVSASLLTPYKTPQLGQGFSMEININEMISLWNYIKILMIGVAFLLLSMVIPIYSIMVTKPHFLLNKK